VGLCQGVESRDAAGSGRTAGSYTEHTFPVIGKSHARLLGGAIPHLVFGFEVQPKLYKLAAGVCLAVTSSIMQGRIALHLGMGVGREDEQ